MQLIASRRAYDKHYASLLLPLCLSSKLVQNPVCGLGFPLLNILKQSGLRKLVFFSLPLRHFAPKGNSNHNVFKRRSDRFQSGFSNLDSKGMVSRRFGMVA